jgi:hypothetical protein
MHRIWIIYAHDQRRRKHRVIGIDLGSIFGGLLDSLHFLFAAGMVQGTNNNGLAEEDIFRGA